MKRENIRKLAEEWDIRTDAMQTVMVPDGYKAEYVYEQPLLYDGNSITQSLPNVSYLPLYGWGVVSVKTDHELDTDEMEEYMGAFTQEGAECIGRLRLTKQTVTLDTAENEEWPASDVYPHLHIS